MFAKHAYNLALNDEEKKLLDQLTRKTEKERIELLRDLARERVLECQIYAAREQYFWVPWTVLLAGSLGAIVSASGMVALGVTTVSGVAACVLGYLRREGLEVSLLTLNERHKWTFHLCRDKPDTPAVLRPLGFDFRTYEDKNGVYDDRHMRGFRYPLDAIQLTPYLWLFLIGAALMKWKLG